MRLTHVNVYCVFMSIRMHYMLHNRPQKQLTKKNSGQLHCGIVRGAVLMAPKHGLCMSDTTDFKKGGVHICSYLMCACCSVLICTRISVMHGARAGIIIAGNTCF